MTRFIRFVMLIWFLLHTEVEKNKSDYSISHFVTLLVYLLFDEESMSFDQWSDTNKNILYYTNN